MFTGLVEETGELLALERSAAGARLTLRAPLVSTDARLGDSIAVNGCCLTVTARDGDALAFDLLAETLDRTNLGALAPGSSVNLERALAAHSRLGGHFVQGHVDATGTIEDIRPAGESFWITIEFPPLLAPYIVRKGSIAIDGISLTVAGVDERRLDVQIIPYTWEHTTLKFAKKGDVVNLEVDILGKYVVRVAELAGMTPKQRTTH